MIPRKPPPNRASESAFKGYPLTGAIGDALGASLAPIAVGPVLARSA
jgi:hypothetical protein